MQTKILPLSHNLRWRQDFLGQGMTAHFDHLLEREVGDLLSVQQ